MPKGYVKVYYAFGEWHSITEWSKITGLPRATIYNRLKKLPDNGTFEDVLRPSKKPRLFKINGEKHTLREWSEITGIPWNRMHARVNRLKPGEPYDKLIVEYLNTSTRTNDSMCDCKKPESNKNKRKARSNYVPKRPPTKYYAFGEEHTLKEWSQIIDINPELIKNKMRYNPESLSFETILTELNDQYHHPLKKYVPTVPIEDVKKQYESDPELYFKWQCFVTYVRKNPFFREYLKDQQSGLCPVCRESLGAGTTWMHYLDYDCLCTFTKSPKDLGLYPNPTKNDPNHMDKAPRCEMCMIKNNVKFKKCQSKFILVHGHCNKLLNSCKL